MWAQIGPSTTNLTNLTSGPTLLFVCAVHGFKLPLVLEVDSEQFWTLLDTCRKDWKKLYKILRPQIWTYNTQIASWMASSLHPAFRFDDPSKNCKLNLNTSTNGYKQLSGNCLQNLFGKKINLEYGHFKVKKFQKKFFRFPMHSSMQFPNGKKFHSDLTTWCTLQILRILSYPCKMDFE